MTSFLLQFRGGWVSSSVNSAEIWQIGVRLFMDQSVPDNIGTFPNITITPVEENEPFDAGTYTTNWAYTGALDMSAYMDQISAAASAYFRTTQFSTQMELREWRLYPIADNGKAVQLPSGTAVAVGTLTSPWTGTTGSLLPLEVACVASFYTYKNTNKGRGRVYLPGVPTNSLDGVTGRFSSAYQTMVADNTAQFLTDLSDAGGLADLSIAPVVTGPSGWNLYSVIRQVRAGNVPDSQRRRRNRLIELYTNADVPVV